MVRNEGVKDKYIEKSWHVQWRVWEGSGKMLPTSSINLCWPFGSLNTRSTVLEGGKKVEKQTNVNQ